MKGVWELSFILSIFVLGISLTQDTIAECLMDLNWPGKPCYDTLPHPPLVVKINDWKPYYAEQGEEWMQMKKNEMLEAYEQGRISEWTSREFEVRDPISDVNLPNWNVCYYYYLYGQIPRCSEGITDYDSPYKQLKEHGNSQLIFCNYGLELVFKTVDESPACVKPSTFWKLVERGWTGFN